MYIDIKQVSEELIRLRNFGDLNFVNFLPLTRDMFCAINA